MKQLAINITNKPIEQLCRQYQIRELAVFGSVLSPEFRSESDVDVLVTFAPGCQYDLYDLAELSKELEVIFSRPVDLIEKAALKNPFRKKHILENMEVIYAA